MKKILSLFANAHSKTQHNYLSSSICSFTLSKDFLELPNKSYPVSISYPLQSLEKSPGNQLFPEGLEEALFQNKLRIQLQFLFNESPYVPISRLIYDE